MVGVPAAPADTGRLISIEGLNGVGKSYLTERVADAISTRGEQAPLVLEEFSRRTDGNSDLGRRLLRTLVTASNNERFLRGGYPASETLLLLAVKMHDYETVLPHLSTGRMVIEGRSIHSIAVYQSLITHPGDDEAAFDYANTILDLAAGWRPLPDLTIMLIDEVDAAIRRAEHRNQAPFTPEQWEIHRRAAELFERLAAVDTEHIRLLDRREHDTDTLIAAIDESLATAPTRPFYGVVAAQLTHGSGRG